MKTSIKFLLNNFVVVIFLFLSTIVFSADNTKIEFKGEAIRNLSTACGFYLVPKENTTFGKALTKRLDINELKEWLATHPPIEESYKLFAVGVPMDRKLRNQFLKEVQSLLDENQIKVPLDYIRRISDFLADQRGIYLVNQETGVNEKISGLDPNDPQMSEETLDIIKKNPNKSIVVVGLPLFSIKKKEILRKRLQEIADNPIKFESNVKATVKKALSEPGSALKHLAHKLQYFFPMKEDYQTPSKEEIETTYRKLVIPGILTFAVSLGVGQKLSVVVPVTIVNAANSALTAVYRTFLGNWWRRSTNFFPSQWLKQLCLGAIFTVDLYWAGAGKGIASALSFAGWMNMFASKWASVIFNSVWRSPLHYVVSRWEEWRNANNNTVGGNEKTRQTAASMEKFISYFMTQFFILSIVMHDGLFKIAQGAGKGIYFTKGDIGKADTLLMNFNIGHAVMLGVGLSYLLAVKNPAVIEPGARIVDKLEAWENKIYDKVKINLYKFTSFIAPLARFL